MNHLIRSPAEGLIYVSSVLSVSRVILATVQDDDDEDAAAEEEAEALRLQREAAEDLQPEDYADGLELGGGSGGSSSSEEKQQQR